MKQVWANSLTGAKFMGENSVVEKFMVATQRLNSLWVNSVWVKSPWVKDIWVKSFWAKSLCVKSHDGRSKVCG